MMLRRADPNAENSQGMSPLDTANKMASQAVYNAIVKAGGKMLKTEAKDPRRPSHVKSTRLVWAGPFAFPTAGVVPEP